jgi:hypothetical protein
MSDGGGCAGGTDRLDELRDPSNFEFMKSENGEKIHIVGTGLPTSMLVHGGRAEGRYDDDDHKALCGLVSDFEPADEIFEDVNEVLDRVCTRCNRQAGYIRNKGKFKEVPL